MGQLSRSANELWPPRLHDLQNAELMQAPAGAGAGAGAGDSASAALVLVRALAIALALVLAQALGGAVAVGAGLVFRFGHELFPTGIERI